MYYCVTGIILFYFILFYLVLTQKLIHYKMGNLRLKNNLTNHRIIKVITITKKLRIPIFMRMLQRTIRFVLTQNQELISVFPTQFACDWNTPLRSSKISFVVVGVLYSVCANSRWFRTSCNVFWKKPYV